MSGSGTWSWREKSLDICIVSVYTAKVRNIKGCVMDQIKLDADIARAKIAAGKHVGQKYRDALTLDQASNGEPVSKFDVGMAATGVIVRAVIVLIFCIFLIGFLIACAVAACS